MKGPVLHVRMNELPGVIRESVRAVLKARGLALYGAAELRGDEFEVVLRDVGNNVAQSVTLLDENPVNLNDDRYAAISMRSDLAEALESEAERRGVDATALHETVIEHALDREGAPRCH